MDIVIRSLTRAYQVEPTDYNAHKLATAMSRIVAPEDTVKILISGGFGAGWSTWAGGDETTRSIMLTFAPLIEAVERGEEITETHPAVLAMIEACAEAGAASPYLGGVAGLGVEEVTGPFIIREYDGSESITTLESFLRAATLL